MEAKAAEWGVALPPREIDDGQGGAGANKSRAEAA
jgi:hypothetical protein